MQKIQKNLVVIAIAVLVALGLGFALLNQKQTETKTTSSTTTNSEQKEFVAALTIDTGTEKQTFDLTSEVIGKTVLEVTEQNAQIVKTGEGKNAFITSINGRVADSAKKEFWKLIINGKDAEMGAGSLTVADGDSITWEIDTF